MAVPVLGFVAMSVDFLSDQEAAAFGRYGGVPSGVELERFFFLDVCGERLIFGESRKASTAARTVNPPAVPVACWRCSSLAADAAMATPRPTYRITCTSVAMIRGRVTAGHWSRV